MRHYAIPARGDGLERRIGLAVRAAVPGERVGGLAIGGAGVPSIRLEGRHLGEWDGRDTSLSALWCGGRWGGNRVRNGQQSEDGDGGNSRGRSHGRAILRRSGARGVDQPELRADVAKPGFINGERDAASSGAKGILKRAATQLQSLDDMRGANPGGRRRQRRHMDGAWAGKCR